MKRKNEKCPFYHSETLFFLQFNDPDWRPLGEPPPPAVYIYIHNYIDFWRINGSIISAKPQDKLKQDKFRATATPLWWGDVEKLEKLDNRQPLQHQLRLGSWFNLLRTSVLTPSDTNPFQNAVTHQSVVALWHFELSKYQRSDVALPGSGIRCGQ